MITDQVITEHLPEAVKLETGLDPLWVVPEIQLIALIEFSGEQKKNLKDDLSELIEELEAQAKHIKLTFDYLF